MARLRREVGGVVEGADTAAFERDFGGHMRRRPLAVVRATSEAEVARALAFARASRLPVVVRGAGHSCRGQTLSEGGLVLEHFGEGADFEVMGDDLVRVQASSRWSALERGLNRMGRACPVLTNYMEFSVGGTLSVGGYGFTSIRQGSQADQVRSLRLVLPDGRAVTCSPDENAALFEHALCGVGQVGVITSVVMRTVPHRPGAQMWWYKHERPTDICGVIEGLAAFPDAPFDEFSAVVFPHLAQTELRCAPEARGSARGAMLLHAALPPGPTVSTVTGEGVFEAAERVRRWTYDDYPDHDRLWTDYKLSPQGAIRMLRAVHEEGRVRRPESTYVLGIRLCEPRFPMSSVATIEGPLAFSVGTFHMVPRGDARALDEARAALRETLALAIELGGRPYLYGFNEMGEAEKERVYGAAYARLRAMRRELDPEGLFNAGAF